MLAEFLISTTGKQQDEGTRNQWTAGRQAEERQSASLSVGWLCSIQLWAQKSLFTCHINQSVNKKIWTRFFEKRSSIVSQRAVRKFDRLVSVCNCCRCCVRCNCESPYYCYLVCKLRRYEAPHLQWQSSLPGTVIEWSLNQFSNIQSPC